VYRHGGLAGPVFGGVSAAADNVCTGCLQTICLTVFSPDLIETKQRST
jgi:hypothetical protein